MIGKITDKIELYADDQALFLIHPNTSIKALLNLASIFFFWLKNNWCTIETLPLSRRVSPLLRLSPRLKMLDFRQIAPFIYLYNK